MVWLTDRLNMTIAVDRNVKNQIQRTNKATMNIIWATPRENWTLLHAYIKDVDQPVHSCSLVSAFVIDPMKRNITRLQSMVHHRK